MRRSSRASWCRPPSGLDLLASAERAGDAADRAAAARTLVELAASQYGYTVLDVPRSDLGVLDTLDLVSNLVVVANQELATVRNAGRMAVGPARSGTPRPRSRR